MRDLCASVHESVFQSQALPSAIPEGAERSLCWEQHARLLPGVEGLVASKVSQWSASQVAQFVQTVTGQEDQASKFLEQVSLVGSFIFVSIFLATHGGRGL